MPNILATLKSPAVCFPIWKFANRADPFAAAIRHIECHYAGDPLQAELLESVRAMQAALPQSGGREKGASSVKHC